MKSIRSILLRAILLITILCGYGQVTYASNDTCTFSIVVSQETETSDSSFSSESEQFDDDHVTPPTHIGSLSTRLYQTTISQGAIVLRQYSPAIWLPPKI